MLAVTCKHLSLNGSLIYCRNHILIYAL
uniref:Uncharacterized protein n=1 Tax=Arundo donax TaxID=35708 RepID=A0A0A9SVX3_ARUDO